MINSTLLINEINTFSQGKLNRKDDLLKLFDLIKETHREHLLEEISFTAKYVMGLLRVLKAGVNNSEVKSLEHVKQDFSANMKKITEELKKVIADADEGTKQYLGAEYLQMTQEGLRNLNLLLSDLEWTKKYLNSQKRQNKN